MPAFNKLSEYRLSTCHPELILLFEEVIKIIDCEVTCGYRGRAEQEKAFDTGMSKEHYPQGKHNSMPSNAVDVYILPVDMKILSRFYYFAGYVLGVAEKLREEGKMKSKIRWGGDWQRDPQLIDQKGLKDLVHFEIFAG